MAWDRERHLLVDAPGLLLSVNAATADDRGAGAGAVAARRLQRSSKVAEVLYRINRPDAEVPPAGRTRHNAFYDNHTVGLGPARSEHKRNSAWSHCGRSGSGHGQPSSSESVGSPPARAAKPSTGATMCVEDGADRAIVHSDRVNRLLPQFGTVSLGTLDESAADALGPGVASRGHTPRWRSALAADEASHQDASCELHPERPTSFLSRASACPFHDLTPGCTAARRWVHAFASLESRVPAGPGALASGWKSTTRPYC
jgi:hypothetical protein